MKETYFIAIKKRRGFNDTLQNNKVGKSQKQLLKSLKFSEKLITYLYLVAKKISYVEMFTLCHLLQIDTVDSLYLEQFFSVPFHLFQSNFLSISNKFLGPLRVRYRESPLHLEKLKYKYEE